MGKPAYGWTQTNTSDPRSFLDNLEDLTSSFPLHDSGFFGEKTRSSRVRTIPAFDPLSSASEFAGKASKNAAEEKVLPTGIARKMKDGTIITLRAKSTSDGTPAVDLNISRSGPVKSQKIHFVTKRR